MTTTQSKICKKCGKEKPLADYYKNIGCKLGRTGVCIECAKDKAVAYRIANKDKVLDSKRRWRNANREKIKETSKRYYSKNKIKIKVKFIKYNLIYPEKKKASTKAYSKANPEKYRAFCRKYKALKRGNSHEPYTDSYIFERDNWTCQLCGKRIDKNLKRPNPLSKSIDHIIPLSKGGADAPINLQATHLRCNVSKSSKAMGQLRLIG
jgi:5-methylcytosine-specific restriction endonuclease McrA